MFLNITNSGPRPIPIVGDSWAEIIAPGAMVTLDYPDTVWIVGDKAGILKNVGKSLKIIADFLLQHKRPKVGEVLSISVVNNGPNPVRVIPGSVTTETDIVPTGIESVTGTDYIELRELQRVDPVENPVHGSGTPN